MGNGALPHGPSYRAHPRLYLNGPASRRDRCLLIECSGLDATVALGLFMDPVAEVGWAKML